MQHIPTSSARANELKKLAKRLQRQGEGTHTALLDMVAKQAGYHHWHHVVQCLKATESQSVSETPATATQHITAEEVALLVERANLPFGLHADATGFFGREPDRAQRTTDQKHIVSLCGTIGIYEIEELTAVLESAVNWSAEYFRALAHSTRAHTKSSRWRSETDFLFLLVLIATQPNVITQATLMDMGWSEDLAVSTLQTARTFRNGSH